MPDPNLQAYLATHYLSGPKADAILSRTTSDGKLKKKKKKRPKVDASEASSSGSGLIIKDDSDSWMVAPGDEDEDGGLTPQVVGGDAGPSRSFKRVGGSSIKAEDKTDAEGAVESSIQGVATAAGEEPPTELKAGLRSKEEMKAARLAREERRKREAVEQASRPATNPASPHATAAADEDDEEARLAQQTVYRDSSGRIIDIHGAEAEERRLSLERQRKEAERSTWGQGLVQKQQAAAAKAQLASASTQTIARCATDKDYNEHFRAQERADDPALAFLTKKRTAGPQKPKYKGPYPPNRFNIAPGYRWDGVDRGNGFERALVERKGVLANREREARAWGQSDM